MIRHTRQSRLITWWRSDARAARRAAARNARVGLDIALAHLDPGVDTTLTAGLYPVIHDALARGTNVFDGTPLLTPPQLTRAAREAHKDVVAHLVTTKAVLDNFAADIEADPSLADQYAEEFGEHGDVAELRRGWAS